MLNTIQIVPITEYQQELYIKYVENHQNLIKNIKGLSTETLLQKFKKNHDENYPRFHNLQYNSIPDFINGIKIDVADKENILLGEVEKVKSYSKDLVTFSIEDGILKYYNLSTAPIIIEPITNLDSVTFQNYSTPKFIKKGEEDQIATSKVATVQQKTQYIKHIECLMYNIKPIIKKPALSEHQLLSLPNIIDGNELNNSNKFNLLFEQFTPITTNENQKLDDLKSYTISNKGEIVKSFETKDETIKYSNPYKKHILFVKKEECIYSSKKISEDISKTLNEPGEKYEVSKSQNNIQEKIQLLQGTYNRVFINPITPEQIIKHSEFKKVEREIHIEEINLKKNSSNILTEDNFIKIGDLRSENYKARFPEFTIEQLNSVPDSFKINYNTENDNIVGQFKISDQQKKEILVGNTVDFFHNYQDKIIKETFLLSNSRELQILSSHNGNKPLFLQNKPVYIRKEDVIFKNSLLKSLNSEIKKEEKQPREKYEVSKPKYNIQEKMNDLNSYVSVIPVTEEQKKNYSKYLDSQKFSNLENVYFPEFSKEQLDSVPDKINGIDLKDNDKMMLLLDSWSPRDYDNYKINADNNIINIYMVQQKHDEDPYEKIDIIKQNQISFNDNLTLKTIKIMSTNVDLTNAKVSDVQHHERPLKVKDPIAINHDGKILQGKVSDFLENGDIKMSVTNSKDLKELTITDKDQDKIVPMFYLDKDQKTKYYKFSYEESLDALYKSENQSTVKIIENNSEKSPVFQLAIGNKTDVIPFEKLIEGKMTPVEGRLELRRKPTTGEAYVHGEVKHRELNLDLPIYGLQLSELQKKDLLERKDIGLVEGFKSKDGKEFSLWLSLDDQLNRVVTAPERSININMIFGILTTDDQKADLKSGNTIQLPMKNGLHDYKVSAATKQANGLISKKTEIKLEKKTEVGEKQKKNKNLKL